MASYVRAPRRTFRATAAIAQNLRVKVGSDGRISVAAANETEIGTTERPSFAANDEIAVNLATLEGTTLFVAAGTIAAGAKVYGAAAGKVSATATSAVPIGIALFGAAADQQIEVVRRDLTVTAAE